MDYEESNKTVDAGYQMPETRLSQENDERLWEHTQRNEFGRIDEQIKRTFNQTSII